MELVVLADVVVGDELEGFEAGAGCLGVEEALEGEGAVFDAPDDGVAWGHGGSGAAGRGVGSGAGFGDDFGFGEFVFAVGLCWWISACVISVMVGGTTLRNWIAVTSVVISCFVIVEFLT